MAEVTHSKTPTARQISGETEPWRDPERYKSGKQVRCLGCGNTCHETHWGKWCYGCNVARIERINKAFEPFARTQPEKR